MEVVRIEDLDFAVPTERTLPEWAVPDLGPSPDQYRVAFSALAIRDGDTRVVVDPWLQADRESQDADARAQRLLGELATEGFPAASVDAVVNSHLEGIGWTTRPDGDDWALSFPNARHLYPDDEIAAVERDEPLPGIDDFRRLATLTDIEAVAAPHGLSGSISVEPTSGHSVGHQVVRVDDGEHVAIYLGHLLIHPLQLVDPAANPVDDGDDAAAVRQHYLGDLADRGGTLLTTLVGGSGGGPVQRDGTGYRV